MLKLCYDVNPEMSDQEINPKDNSSWNNSEKNEQRIETTEFMVGEASTSSNNLRGSNPEKKAEDPQTQQLLIRIQQLKSQAGRSNHYYSNLSRNPKADFATNVEKEPRPPDVRSSLFQMW
ncbi:hypothetical protein JTB14_002210 [Gonioctena quinquepunctata]|nr:hypothetical protein JTB14_002210 [Gonioctena quinquepunctata]